MAFKMKGSPMKRNFNIGTDSPMKETTTQTLQGMSFDPYAHQTLRAEDIPSFRDMVSLEQQQAARKAWKEKRAGKKEERAAQAETERKQRVEEFAKTLPETKTINEPEIEDPLLKHVTNQPLNVPGLDVKTEEG